nr:pentatricopeptide repeat-containing protein At4g14850-like [Ipomoea batatas]
MVMVLTHETVSWFDTYCNVHGWLIRLSALELMKKAVKMAVGTGLIKLMNPIAVNRYKRFSKAGLAVELNKPNIQQLRLIEMQMLSVVFHFAAQFEFDRDDEKFLFNMINDLTRVEKAKNAVIQFQISPAKIDIEQSIVVPDYTQMDRILKEERTTLIKSCSNAKESATDGEKEDLVELEEQLLKMRFQSLHQNKYNEDVFFCSSNGKEHETNLFMVLSVLMLLLGWLHLSWEGQFMVAFVVKACIEDCERASYERPKRNLITWNDLVDGYVHQRHANMELDSFEDMTRKTQDVVPNYITFVHVLIECTWEIRRTSRSVDAAVNLLVADS